MTERSFNHSRSDTRVPAKSKLSGCPKERKLNENIVDHTILHSVEGPNKLPNMSGHKLLTGFTSKPRNQMGRVVPLEGAILDRLGPRTIRGIPMADYGPANSRNGTTH